MRIILIILMIGMIGVPFSNNKKKIKKDKTSNIRHCKLKTVFGG